MGIVYEKEDELFDLLTRRDGRWHLVPWHNLIPSSSPTVGKCFGRDDIMAPLRIPLLLTSTLLPCIQTEIRFNIWSLPAQD